MILHYCIDKQEKMPNLDVRKLTHSEAPIHSPKIVFAPPTIQTEEEAEHHQTTEFNNASSIPKENKQIQQCIIHSKRKQAETIEPLKV